MEDLGDGAAGVGDEEAVDEELALWPQAICHRPVKKSWRRGLHATGQEQARETAGKTVDCVASLLRR